MRLLKKMLSDNVKLCFFVLYISFYASCILTFGSAIPPEHFSKRVSNSNNSSKVKNGTDVVKKDIPDCSYVLGKENTSSIECSNTSKIEPHTTEKIKSSTDTEVDDLTNNYDKSHSHVATPSLPKNDSNLVEVNKSLKGNEKLNLVIDKITPESKSDGKKYFNTKAGTIATVMCITLAVASYIGIMLWKNIIQRSYQNREILLNEDDLGDINDEDMRHFEAACIQIEG